MFQENVGKRILSTPRTFALIVFQYSQYSYIKNYTQFSIERCPKTDAIYGLYHQLTAHKLRQSCGNRWHPLGPVKQSWTLTKT